MTSVTIEGREFRAPGPGSWELDAVHFAKPMTRFVTDLIPAPFAEGFARGCELYGLTLDRFQPAPQHGVWYHRAVPFGAPPDATAPPPKIVMQLMTRLHPRFRRRLAKGVAAFDRRAWREDLRDWDARVKPHAIEQHLRLQREDPDTLDDGALARHVAASREHLAWTWRLHHDYTASAIMPVGDYLAHAITWTGLAPGELLRLLQGSSPVSRGAGAQELDALARLVRGDAKARAALDLPAERALESLVQQPAPVGPATRAWLDVVGHRSLGYDVADPFALELPQVLVDSLRASLDAPSRAKEKEEALARRTAEIRSMVPPARRAEFDDLLSEARATNRLRDERGNYADSWATGLARRALLASGRRLASRGVLDDPALAIDATAGEIVALLTRTGGPGNDELKEHRRWRTSHEASEFPPWLGAPPSPPPPAEWLPAHARRTQRALDAALSALFLEPPPKIEVGATTTLSGLPVSPGTYDGPARLVKDSADFARIRKGDVLVTRATSATFNVVLPLLGAIVTDRGGQLCHAAIVAREHAIPGVVGTREATSRIQDGSRVRVDGSAGVVTVLT